MWGRGGRRRDSSCSLLLENRIFGALPIVCVAGFKGRKIDNFITDGKNTTITVFDKPVSENFSSNIKTENMGSSHPLCSAMKCRFKMLVVKCLSQKIFGILLSQCLIVIAASFLKVLQKSSKFSNKKNLSEISLGGLQQKKGLWRKRLVWCIVL